MRLRQFDQPERPKPGRDNSAWFPVLRLNRSMVNPCLGHTGTAEDWFGFKFTWAMRVKECACHSPVPICAPNAYLTKKFTRYLF